MITRNILLALILASTTAFAAVNNDWPKVKQECNEIIHPNAPVDALWKRMMACGTGFFTARPVHLTVKSIVPGGGFGLGPTFQADFNQDKWQNKLTATAVGSMRKFWSTEMQFRATHQALGKDNSARDRFAMDFYVRAHDLPLMPFYGIGPNVNTSTLTDFRERDVVAGVDLFNPFSSWLAGGAILEGIWPEVGGVTETGRRSITTVFSETTAPGLTAQPNLIHYGAYGEPRRTRHKFQFDYKVGYHFYQDHDTGHYSFRRFMVDGTHTFHPTGQAESVLTIHDRLSLSSASAGSVVPFYMQETLGGSDINGLPTLRGFGDYRFRAPNLALIQVEYDHRVWGPLGLLGFYDTGQVANRAGDMSWAGMRHSFGFGFSIWAGNRQWFKVHVGLGSGEGHHTYIGIPSF